MEAGTVIVLMLSNREMTGVRSFMGFQVTLLSIRYPPTSVLVVANSSV